MTAELKEESYKVKYSDVVDGKNELASTLHNIVSKYNKNHGVKESVVFGNAVLKLLLSQYRNACIEQGIIFKE